MNSPSKKKATIQKKLGSSKKAPRKATSSNEEQLSHENKTPLKQSLGISFEDSENSKVFGDQSYEDLKSKETPLKSKKKSKKAEKEGQQKSENSFVNYDSLSNSVEKKEKESQKFKKSNKKQTENSEKVDEPGNSREVLKRETPAPKGKEIKGEKTKKFAPRGNRAQDILGEENDTLDLLKESATKNDDDVLNFIQSQFDSGVGQSGGATPGGKKNAWERGLKGLNSPESGKNKESVPDRSKSSNRVFRKIGDSRIEGQDGLRLSLLESRTFEGKERAQLASAENENECVGDEEAPIGDYRHRKRLLESAKSKTHKQEEEDSEAVLEKRIKEILGGEPSGSQPRETDEDLVGGLPEFHIKNAELPVPRSEKKALNDEEEPAGDFKIETDKPESRFHEIRARAKQQRAKSRIPDNRSGTQRAELFQREALDLREPLQKKSEKTEAVGNWEGGQTASQVHRSFLRDNRHSDLGHSLAEFVRTTSAVTGMEGVSKTVLLSEVDLPREGKSSARGGLEPLPEIPDYKAARSKNKQQLLEEQFDNPDHLILNEKSPLKNSELEEKEPPSENHKSKLEGKRGRKEREHAAVARQEEVEKEATPPLEVQDRSSKKTVLTKRVTEIQERIPDDDLLLENPLNEEESEKNSSLNSDKKLKKPSVENEKSGFGPDDRKQKELTTPVKGEVVEESLKSPSRPPPQFKKFSGFKSETREKKRKASGKSDKIANEGEDNVRLQKDEERDILNQINNDVSDSLLETKNAQVENEDVHEKALPPQLETGFSKIRETKIVDSTNEKNERSAQKDIGLEIDGGNKTKQGKFEEREDSKIMGTKVGGLERKFLNESALSSKTPENDFSGEGGMGETQKELHPRKKADESSKVVEKNNREGIQNATFVNAEIPKLGSQKIERLIDKKRIEEETLNKEVRKSEEQMELPMEIGKKALRTSGLGEKEGGEGKNHVLLPEEKIDELEKMSGTGMGPAKGTKPKGQFGNLEKNKEEEAALLVPEKEATSGRESALKSEENADALDNATSAPKKPMPKNRFQMRGKTAPAEEALIPEKQEEVEGGGEGKKVNELENATEAPKKPFSQNKFQMSVKQGAEETKKVTVSEAIPDEKLDVRKEETKPEEKKTEPEKPKTEEKPEDPNSLTAKLKSPNFKIRQEAYTEIQSWGSSEVKPESFARNLHNYIKDKHPLSIEALLGTIDALFDDHPECRPWIDLKSVIENISEHLYSNVKGPSKEKTQAFVVRLWEMSDPDAFMEQLNALLLSGKPKRQEGALNMVSELVRKHKIEEMKQLKPLWTEIGKLINSRTVALKNQTIELYKEAYLWMGEGLRPYLKDLKKQQIDDLDSYFRSLDPSQMKKVEKKAAAPPKAVALTVSDLTKGGKETPPEEGLKEYNTAKWVNAVLAIKSGKEQADKVDELNEKIGKMDALNANTSYEPLVDFVRKLLISANIASRIAGAKTAQLMAEKLAKPFATSMREFHKIMLPKIGEKETQQAYFSALNVFYKWLTLEQVIEEFRTNLTSKSPEVALQTLFLVKSAFDSPEKCADIEKAVRFCELVVKFADDKNSELRNISQQILAGQLHANESKIQPLLKNVSAVSLNSVNQISASIKLSNKASLLKEETAIGDARGARLSAKSNAQRITQIREDAFGNKIIKTSDAKNFGNHLLKNLNFLLEMTGDFKHMFADEAAEMLGFVESLVKVEKVALSEAVRCILVQFYVEQFNNAFNDQVAASFEQFCAFSLKSVSNKVLVTDIINVLLKKQTRVNKEFFQALLGLVDREVNLQATVAGFVLKPLTDFLKFQFGGDNIQIVFKTLLIHTMRLIIKKFGEKSVADFPAVLLNEFDAINEAQRVFEKTIEKLNDKNPEKRKTALIELANYNDPSTILTFWSNDKFISFLKRQITIETKSANYIVLIRILDHYLEIRTISFADFNTKTYIYIFHAVLMNYYDRKEDSHLTEIAELIRKSVQILTSNLILNEMIQADMGSLSWKEQVLNFLNEYAAEVEPSMKILNYLIQILNLKSTGKEYGELLTQIFLRFKNSQNAEILAKGNENKLIREIWLRNEESLIVNADFVRGNFIFENALAFANLKEFLTKNLKIDEKTFYARSIESIDFKANETSFKTKMAYWFIRSVENNARNNDFIIRQMYINESYQEDEIALALATKIVLQVLKNLFHFNTDMFFDNAFRLMGQITMHLGMEGINRTMELLELDSLDYEFFNLILTNVSNENDDDRFGNNGATQFGKTVPNYRSEMSVAKSPMQHKENAVNHEMQNVQMKKQPPNAQMAYEYENNYGSGHKPGIPSMGGKEQLFLQQERQSAEPPARTNSQFNTQTRNQRVKQEEGTLEEYGRLQEMFNKMRTYELDEFENASNYFKEICASKKSVSLNFLTENSCEIVDNFIEVCQTIFNEGINFELKKTDYELIFVPLVLLFEKENFLLAMTREKILAICEFIINQFIMSNEEKKEMDAEESATFEVAEYIVKVWNSLLLRVIDNSDPNMVIHALFYLVNNCQKGQRSKIVEAEVNLALKCVLRISKNLGSFIDRLNPAIVLSAINTYIRTFDVQDAEQLGTKVVKNLLTDFVNMSDAEVILDNYYVLYGRNEESTLLKWILTIQNKKGQVNDGSSQLVDLINELNKQPASVQIKTFFSRFQKVLAANPSLKVKNFEDYFNSREQFTQILKAMNYYSVASSQEQRPGGSLANAMKGGKERAKVLQATTTPLSSAKSGRKVVLGLGKEKANFNEISENSESD